MGVYRSLMPRRESPLQSEMVLGTLDMLIHQTLVSGPAHGHTIAHAIEHGSEDVLQIEHGSLTRRCIGWRIGVGLRRFGELRRTTEERDITG